MHNHHHHQNGGLLFLPDNARNQPIVNLASRKTVDRGDAVTEVLLGERDRLDPTSAPAVGAFAKGRGTRSKPLRIFPYGVSRNRLDQTIARLDVPVAIVRDFADADIVLTLKNAYRQKPQPIRESEMRGIPVYVLRSNTTTQMEHVLFSLFPAAFQADREREQDPPAQPVRGGEPTDFVLSALSEAETAISAVMEGAPATALSPQSPPIRRLQHELAERYSLSSRSRGRDPFRHVEIYRRGIQ
jgi:hypothetical protein